MYYIYGLLEELPSSVANSVAISIKESSQLTVAKSSGKNITFTNAEKLLLSRQAGKNITVTNAEVVSFVRRIGKIISLTDSEFLSFSKQVAKMTALLQTEIVSVSLDKYYLRTVSILQSQKIFLQNSILKIIALLNAQVFTVKVQQSVKVIALTMSQLVAFGKQGPKTTSLTMAQLVTVVAGKVAFPVTISLLTSQFLKFVQSLRPYVPPVKIIPVNYVFRIPYIAASNPLYLNDSATMFIPSGAPAQNINAVTLVITAPDGTVQNRYFPAAWAGNLPSWGIDNFVITQFEPGELDQVGTWSVSLVYNGGVINSGTFFVAKTPPLTQAY